ncbi:MAG: pilus assembly protein PilP, partial [Gammaproteobacteria bacterium]
MNLSDININDLDFNDAGNWPWPVKGFAVALVFVAVVFFGYWYWVSDQFDELHQAERRETSLKREFEHKQSQAAN